MSPQTVNCNCQTNGDFGYEESSRGDMVVEGNNNMKNLLSDSISTRNVEDEKIDDADDAECERFLDEVLTEACKQLDTLYQNRKERIASNGQDENDSTTTSVHGELEQNQIKNNYTNSGKVRSRRGNMLPRTSNSPDHQKQTDEDTDSDENHLEGSTDESCDDSGIFEEDKLPDDTDKVPFHQLQSLCMTHTNIDSWQSLEALRLYPSLKSLRITVRTFKFNFIHIHVLPF